MNSEIFENNIKKIKFLFFFAILICSLIQIFLISEFNNYFSLFWLIFSNILIFLYCFSLENLKYYPISIFSLIFTNFYSNASALFFKSIFFQPIDLNLFDPNFTYFFLFIVNLLLIFVHIIYKKSKLFLALRVKLQKFYFFINLEKSNDKNFLIYLGFFSLLFAFISVTFFGDNIFADMSDGPNIVGDILNVTNIFFICPFIILFTYKFYKFNLKKIDFIIIFLSLILLLYISLGLNARSAFFDTIFVGCLIYSFFILIGFTDIKILKFNKVFFLIVFFIYLGNAIDKFSDSYLETRAQRDITNPLQNIKNHFKSIKRGDNQVKKNELLSNKIFREDYYPLNIVNRINIVKATDNILYAKNYLSKDQIKNIYNYEQNQFISIFPSPFINIFNPNFDKFRYLDSTITSKIYKSVDKYFEGGKSNGLSFAILFLYEDILFIFIFVISTFLTFSLLDSFNFKGSFLIIYFVLMYSTSGSLVNLITSGSLSDFFGTLIRIIPQSILFFILFFKIYKKLLKRS